MNIPLTGRQITGFVKVLEPAFDMEAMNTLLIGLRTAGLAEVAGAGRQRDLYTKLVKVAQSEGWLPRLVRAARDERKSEPHLRDFMSELEVMASSAPAFSELREELIEILDDAGTPDAALLAAYHDFAPAGYEERLDGFRPLHMAAVVVFGLADTAITAGKVPLIEFALKFAHALENRALLAKAEQWTAKAFQAARIDHPMRDAIKSRATTGEEPHDLYLVIRAALQERAAGDTAERKYDVCSWRMKQLIASGEVTQYDARQFGLCTEDELRLRIGELLVGIEIDGARRKASFFALEVFLPHQSLALRVDQWKAHDEMPLLIGASSPCVLRSWDRAFGPFEMLRRGPWERIWQHHRREPFAQRCDLEYCEEEHYPARVCARPVTFVMLDFIPGEHEYGIPGPIRTIARGPAPVALWPRHDIPPAEVPRYLTLLEELGVDPQQCLERVTAERLRAQGEKGEDFGRHLCLLYDDPTRIPVDDSLEVS